MYHVFVPVIPSLYTVPSTVNQNQGAYNMYALPSKKALRNATTELDAEMFSDVADYDEYEPIHVVDYYDEQGTTDTDYVPIWGVRVDI